MSSEARSEEQQHLLVIKSVQDRFNDLENQIENQRLKNQDLEAALAVLSRPHITSADHNNNHTADHENQTLKRIQDLEAALAVLSPPHITSADNHNQSAYHENQTLKIIRDLEAALAVLSPPHITSADNHNHTADHEDNPSRLTPGVVTTSTTAGGGNYSDIQNPFFCTLVEQTVDTWTDCICIAGNTRCQDYNRSRWFWI